MRSERRPVVLVVDDVPELRENIAEILGEEGLEAAVAGSADDALRQLDAGAVAPAAILLDLRLPGMAAGELVSRLRASRAWRATPVVLMTAASLGEIPGDLAVDAVLPKPFGIDQLMRAIRGAMACAGRAAHAA